MANEELKTQIVGVADCVADTALSGNLRGAVMMAAGNITERASNLDQSARTALARELRQVAESISQSAEYVSKPNIGHQI